MAGLVKAAPLFSLQTLRGIVNGIDKDCIKEGDYKNVKGDSERIPLLVLGWFCLIGAKFEKFSGYKFSHVVNLGVLSNNFLSLTNYWEFTDFLKVGAKVIGNLWSLNNDLELTPKQGCQQNTQTIATTILYAGRAFSNLINFAAAVAAVGALKGLNMGKWKTLGSLVSIPYYAFSTYKNLTTKDESPEDIDQLQGQEAQYMYKEQYKWKKLCGTIVIASILAMKIIGLYGIFHNFYGASNVIRFIAEFKEDLLFGAFTTLVIGGISFHLYDQQMRTFKERNKII